MERSEIRGPNKMYPTFRHASYLIIIDLTDHYLNKRVIIKENHENTKSKPRTTPF